MHRCTQHHSHENTLPHTTHIPTHYTYAMHMSYKRTSHMYRNPPTPHIHHTHSHTAHIHHPIHPHTTHTHHTRAHICNTSTHTQHTHTFIHANTSTLHTYINSPMTYTCHTKYTCHTPHPWPHTAHVQHTCLNFSCVHTHNTYMHYHTNMHNLTHIPAPHTMSTHRMCLASAPPGMSTLNLQSSELWGQETGVMWWGHHCSCPLIPRPINFSI